jgi:hypothetical protein
MFVTARPPLDLLDGDWYLNPYETYAWQRENQPVAWDEINELWGIFRYDDVVEIESHDRDFISSDTVKGGYRPNLRSSAWTIRCTPSGARSSAAGSRRARWRSARSTCVTSSPR